MKKHWRKLLLAFIALAAVLTASGAWLGYLPFARPGNEEDFMAEQLRRIRYAGPFRTDHEVAIAERLPEDPDQDDLRIAFFRYREHLYAERATELLDEYPDYANPVYPPTDMEAHRKYTALANECAALETEYALDYAEPSLKGDQEAFLKATADLSDTLKQCTPVAGKMLLQVYPNRPYEIEMMTNSIAPFRVGVARVLLLIQQEQAAQAIWELFDIVKCSHQMSWCPGLFGHLLYVVCTAVVYEKGVLPIAEQRLAPPDWLMELGDANLLSEVDPIESMVDEYRMRFAMQANPSSDSWEGTLERDVARLHISDKFDERGATSLHDWINDEKIDKDNWGAVIRRLEDLRQHPVDFTDADEAERYFVAAYTSPIESHWDQANAIAQFATAGLEPEGLMVAVLLHAARITSPDSWKDEVHNLASAHPFLTLDIDQDGVHVLPNFNHPTVKRSNTEDRVIATVR